MVVRWEAASSRWLGVWKAMRSNAFTFLFLFCLFSFWVLVLKSGASDIVNPSEVSGYQRFFQSVYYYFYSGLVKKNLPRVWGGHWLLDAPTRLPPDLIQQVEYTNHLARGCTDWRTSETLSLLLKPCKVEDGWMDGLFLLWLVGTAEDSVLPDSLRPAWHWPQIPAQIPAFPVLPVFFWTALMLFEPLRLNETALLSLWSVVNIHHHTHSKPSLTRQRASDQRWNHNQTPPLSCTEPREVIRMDVSSLHIRESPLKQPSHRGLGGQSSATL